MPPLIPAIDTALRHLSTLFLEEHEREEVKRAAGLCIMPECHQKAEVNWMCAGCWNHTWMQTHSRWALKMLQNETQNETTGEKVKNR